MAYPLSWSNSIFSALVGFPRTSVPKSSVTYLPSGAHGNTLPSLLNFKPWCPNQELLAAESMCWVQITTLPLSGWVTVDKSLSGPQFSHLSSESVEPDGIEPPLIQSSVYGWLTAPGGPGHVSNSNFAKRAEPGYGNRQRKEWLLHKGCLCGVGVITRGN